MLKVVLFRAALHARFDGSMESSWDWPLAAWKNLNVYDQASADIKAKLPGLACWASFPQDRQSRA